MAMETKAKQRATREEVWLPLRAQEVGAKLLGTGQFEQPHTALTEVWHGPPSIGAAAGSKWAPLIPAYAEAAAILVRAGFLPRGAVTARSKAVGEPRYESRTCLPDAAGIVKVLGRTSGVGS